MIHTKLKPILVWGLLLLLYLLYDEFVSQNSRRLFLGTLVAASVVDKGNRHSWVSIGTNVNMVVQAFYIIPFVLTVGLFFALASQGVTEHRYPHWTVAIVLVVVS